MNKNAARIRRSKRTRAKIRELEVARLTVMRTPRHMYAQIIAADGGKVLAQASTLDTEAKAELAAGYTGNVAAATIVGQLVAKRALAAGVERVAFDRAGFKYHGRVKALADAAREGGLNF